MVEKYIYNIVSVLSFGFGEIPFRPFTKVGFFKNVRDKIIWPKKLQKLPRQLAGAVFFNFLGQMILPSIFLRKTDFIVLFLIINTYFYYNNALEIATSFFKSSQKFLT